MEITRQSETNEQFFKVPGASNAAYQMNMNYGQYPTMPNYMGAPQYPQYQQPQPASQMYSTSSNQAQQQQYMSQGQQYWQSPSGQTKGIEKK